MKRTVCILLLLPILLLTACKSEPPAISETFRLNFTVSQGDVDYEGIVDRSDDTLTVAMTSPYTVEDTVFRYDDDGLSVCYGTHSARANCDYLPYKSIPTVLYNASVYLSQASFVEKIDGEDHYTLPTPHGDAQLTAADGIPAELYDPNSGLTFHFEIPT